MPSVTAPTPHESNTCSPRHKPRIPATEADNQTAANISQYDTALRLAIKQKKRSLPFRTRPAIPDDPAELGPGGCKKRGEAPSYLIGYMESDKIPSGFFRGHRSMTGSDGGPESKRSAVVISAVTETRNEPIGVGHGMGKGLLARPVFGFDCRIRGESRKPAAREHD